MLQSRLESREKAGVRGQRGRGKRESEHSPWLLFLDRFLRSSLGSLANPNSKSFSLIFGFGRFIVSPLKIRSTGSVVHSINRIGINSTFKGMKRSFNRIERTGRKSNQENYMAAFSVTVQTFLLVID